MKKIILSALAGTLMMGASCTGNGNDQTNRDRQTGERIVSLNGTVTEVLCTIGLKKDIVGTDVTSTYPAAVASLPKVGHNREVSAEAVISLKPTLVIGLDDNMKPELKEQIKAANIKLILFHLDHSIAGAKKLVTDMADSLGQNNKAAGVCAEIDRDAASAIKPATAPKVLFIYARGTGTMMVAGKHNAINNMIELAGGQNAIKDFDDFKPLTSEAVVAADPDVILMFDKGLQSIGGIKGLLQAPGVSQTNAGKNGKVIEMDGQFLTGFSPRVGKAIVELANKLNEAAKH